MIKSHNRKGFCVSFHDIQLFSAFLFFLLIPLKNTGIVHYVIWLGVIATTANVFFTLKNTGCEKKYVVIFCMILLTMIVSLFTSNKNIDSGLFYAVVCYFSLYWLIALNSHFSFAEREKDTIFRFAVMSGIVFSVYSFMPFAYYRDNNTVAPTLTLYFGNSNLTGIYLFATICLLSVLFSRARHKKLLALLIAYLFYLTWLTGARTCMVAAVFVLVSSIVPVRFHVPKVVVVVAFLFPIVFVPLYLALFRSGYADITLMGKSLFSGRQGTFLDYLSLLHTPLQWCVGNLGEANLANAHNAPLAHLCSTGLIGTSLFYGMMLNKVLNSTKNSSTKMQRTALICILGFFLQSSGEASIFLGGFPGSVFVYLLFLCMREENDADNICI